jgi:hypothetical protein
MRPAIEALRGRFGQGPSLEERGVALVGALAGVFAFIAATANITNLALSATSALIAYLAYRRMRSLEQERESDTRAKGLVPPPPPYDPYTYVPPTPAQHQQQRVEQQARRQAVAAAHPTRSRVYDTIAMLVGLTVFVGAGLFIIWLLIL